LPARMGSLRLVVLSCFLRRLDHVQHMAKPFGGKVGDSDEVIHAKTRSSKPEIRTNDD
jgi:hypothetical protein